MSVRWGISVPQIPWAIQPPQMNIPDAGKTGLHTSLQQFAVKAYLLTLLIT